MGVKEILRLSWIKVIIIVVLLILFYYGVWSSALIGSLIQPNWTIFATLFFITLIYFVISITATIYLKVKR